MADVKEIFEARRSVNFFDKQRELDDQVLQDIINLAALAPSAFNLQPWEIIAVKSEAAKKRLYPLASNQSKILEAPVTLMIIGDRAGAEKNNPQWADLQQMIPDKNAFEQTQSYAYSLYGSTPERRIKFAESNAGLLAALIMVAAKYYGVDSHPMSGIDFEGIQKEFQLGPGKDVVMLIALGYLDQSKTLYPRRKRKNFKDMVRMI
jgi:putative NAD(P)H nitroreductase